MFVDFPSVDIRERFLSGQKIKDMTLKVILQNTMMGKTDFANGSFQNHE